mgnify:CR=1 FL=1
MQASDGGVPSKSAVESVYVNVTCAAPATQRSFSRNLLETATVDSFANLTIFAQDARGRRIPSGQVEFRLDHGLFYVLSDGLYLLLVTYVNQIVSKHEVRSRVLVQVA